jgi:hypothetical protein
MYQEGQQEDTHGDNNVASFTNVLINYVIDGFFVSVLYSVDQSIPFDEYICGIGIEKKNAFFPLKGRGVHNILFAPNYIIWAITINKYFFHIINVARHLLCAFTVHHRKLLTIFFF